MEVVSAMPGTRRMIEPMITLSMLWPSPSRNSTPPTKATKALAERLVKNLERLCLPTQ